MKIISLYAGDVGTESAEETPKNPISEQKRRSMTYVLCLKAANRTSELMARRLCLAWFNGHCDHCPKVGQTN